MNSNINSMEEKKSAKHQHHHQQQQSLTRLVTLFAIVAVIIAQSVLFVPTAEARYLPTRSNVDQLKRQEIKEILRLVSAAARKSTHQSASLSLTFFDCRRHCCFSLLTQT